MTELYRLIFFGSAWVGAVVLYRWLRWRLR